MSDRPEPIGLVPKDKRPPGATKGFIMRPGTLVRGEQMLKRELKILEWQIRTRQIDRAVAIERGHKVLENHYEMAIRTVEEEASEMDLGKVNRGDSELQQLLRKSKRNWIQIVDDLLAL